MFPYEPRKGIPVRDFSEWLNDFLYYLEKISKSQLPVELTAAGNLKVAIMEGAVGGGLVQLQARDTSYAWFDVGLYIDSSIPLPVITRPGETIDTKVTSMPKVVQSYLGREIISMPPVVQSYLGREIISLPKVVQSYLGREIISMPKVVQSYLGREIIAMPKVVQSYLGREIVSMPKVVQSYLGREILVQGTYQTISYNFLSSYAVDVHVPASTEKSQVLGWFLDVLADIEAELRFPTSGFIGGLPSKGVAGMNLINLKGPTGTSGEAIELWASGAGTVKGWIVYKDIPA